ncbi:hypothetical protein Y1Q_0011732 [Alligator mississippiensis]|uniref:Uncharacterized protein n=1 Tax=Alligator mississippiensis TaxID=8496 RepID=A0A151M0Y1_ALLMI|nr:hypothetical protein Y1Q_0011732 [Alligator mississippiensis]
MISIPFVFLDEFSIQSGYSNASSCFFSCLIAQLRKKLDVQWKHQEMKVTCRRTGKRSLHSEEISSPGFPSST